MVVISLLFTASYLFFRYNSLHSFIASTPNIPTDPLTLIFNLQISSGYDV